MKKIRIEDALGLTICHDMTRIVPGVFKGVAFKKGHVITKEDIPVLKSMGKNHIYVGDIPEGFIHEDECAERIANAICSRSEFYFTDVAEGKITISSKIDGVFKIDANLLYELNRIEHIAIASIYDNTIVSKGQKVVSERIIPLYTRTENIKKLEGICKGKKLFEVKPFINQKVHLIITGNEVYNGLIEDKSYASIYPKVEKYGCSLTKTVKAPDDKDIIRLEIRKSCEEGAEIILLTGGMSVDEDDLTPVSIKEEADCVITHGTPVQPGNMFLLAYKNGIPIMGLPGAVIFREYTIFDIVFPLIASKMELDKEFFIRLSHGGLCYFCNECHYPNCTFGKGR